METKLNSRKDVVRVSCARLAVSPERIWHGVEVRRRSCEGPDGREQEEKQGKPRVGLAMYEGQDTHCWVQAVARPKKQIFHRSVSHQSRDACWH